MPWIKIPAEHHPLFHAAVPKDPRVTTLQMFGGVAAKVNGYMFAGLFGRSAIVRLGDTDRKAALALDGAEPFDPMGNGRVMQDTVLLPEDVLHEPAELRAWLRRGLDHTASLPARAEKKSVKARPAKQAAAKQPAAKPAVATKPSSSSSKPSSSSSKPSSSSSKPSSSKPAAKPSSSSKKPVAKQKPATKKPVRTRA